MKFVFIFSLAIVILAAFTFKPQKEPLTFLGHAQYQNKTASWCVVRAIKAASHKQADSLFRVLVDSCVKADKGNLIKGNYEVWEFGPADIIEINHEHKLKPF